MLSCAPITQFSRDRAAGANVCSSSDATHDLPAQRNTPTNLSNKFSESTTTITTTNEHQGENRAQQEISRTTSEDEEDFSDSRQTGVSSVSSAENSFASAARGLGECERIATCGAGFKKDNA